MKVYLLLLSVFLLFACSSGEKQEVLEMDEIIPSSDRYKEGQDKYIAIVKDYYYDSLRSFSKLVSDSLGVSRQSVYVPDSLLFPDRFFCISKEKWFGAIDGTEVLISVWTYNDSLETKNALFNWLDCFGKRCSVLQLYEERKISSESFLIYVVEKKMFYITSSSSIDAKLEFEILNKLVPKDKILYALSQGLGRKTIWWEFVEKGWNIKKQKE